MTPLYLARLCSSHPLLPVFSAVFICQFSKTWRVEWMPSSVLEVWHLSEHEIIHVSLHPLCDTFKLMYTLKEVFRERKICNLFFGFILCLFKIINGIHIKYYRSPDVSIHISHISKWPSVCIKVVRFQIFKVTQILICIIKTTIVHNVLTSVEFKWEVMYTFTFCSALIFSVLLMTLIRWILLIILYILISWQVMEASQSFRRQKA